MESIRASITDFNGLKTDSLYFRLRSILARLTGRVLRIPIPKENSEEARTYKNEEKVKDEVPAQQLFQILLPPVVQTHFSKSIPGNGHELSRRSALAGECISKSFRNIPRSKIYILKESASLLVKKPHDNRSFISVNLFDKKTVALLDSGANSPIVGKSGLSILEVLKLKIKNSNYKFVTTADGVPQIVKGIVELPLYISCTCRIISALVVPCLKHSIILGRDFCRKFSVSIDFKNNSWEIAGPDNLKICSLENAFWQIPLSDKSKEKTAFAVTGGGLFHLNVLLLDLTNAARAQQRLMEAISESEFESYVFSYLDIILVGPDFDHHMDLLCKIGERKGGKSFWTDKANDAFKNAKQALVLAPVLAIPDFSLSLTLQCDASEVGLGCVLAQEQNGVKKVIAFASRMVFGVEKFRVYVEGANSTVIIDSHSFLWLRRIRDLSGKSARCSVRLHQFNFSLVHRNGKFNIVPAALSRSRVEKPASDENPEICVGESDYISLQINLDGVDDFYKNKCVKYTRPAR
ncbi:hypothetical protein ILUMI_19944 [Ignelater luminosus]|uniref:Reverse transcriptase/retrotransposon-derived protein RNase H-like domain-containing protein n=1 Tax=Ignelater luminosus TaxID=2038154 RepID=A0A8K0G5C7_IGNLU|nr:hypothetical protein ILUMI_19944 [Ignelater luminosus]